MTGRSIALFILAAVLAAYGGIFIVGSLLWGMAFDGFRPDRFDVRTSALP